LSSKKVEKDWEMSFYISFTFSSSYFKEKEPIDKSKAEKTY